jgi:hypothetical protein
VIEIQAVLVLVLLGVLAAVMIGAKVEDRRRREASELSRLRPLPPEGFSLEADPPPGDWAWPERGKYGS